MFLKSFIARFSQTL